MIKLRWFGHSMWKISSKQVSIITDPFADIGYDMNINPSADIVLSSHDHFDHNNMSFVQGAQAIYTQSGNYDYNGVNIKLVESYHDKCQGAERGPNLLMKFTVDSISFLHCGDLGVLPKTEIIRDLGKIDVLMVPVGGIYTIDAQEAFELCGLLNPSLILPMHYQTRALKFELNPVDEFLQLFPDVHQLDNRELEISDQDINPPKPLVFTLNYE